MTKTKRNYGIDLLRIISMFLVVTLYLLNKGGILEHVEQGTTSYYLAWLANVIACCAVNCYELISGYVNVDTKIKYHKLGAIWLQVVFYSFFITLIYYFQYADTFEPYQWTDIFFPVCTRQYWYFTAYFVLFLFMPYLNVLINNLNKTQLKRLGILIFAIFSVAQTIWQQDIVLINNGYSFLWIALLYILGAVLKKINLAEQLKSYWWVLIFIGASAVSYIFKISADATDAPVNRRILISYFSVTTVIQAVSLLAVCIRMNIKNKAAVKLIGFFAPLSFGVYIIHTNPWIFQKTLQDSLIGLTEIRALYMVLAVMGLTIAIFLACCVIEYLRQLLFKALKITPALKKAEDKIMHKINSSACTH